MARYSTIGRGRPSKAYQHLMSTQGIKTEIKKQVKKDVTKLVKSRGRPHSPIESLKIIGGSLRVKRAKSRATIKVGTKVIKV